MVFSKGVLRQLAPRLKECLNNLLTAHEDIELGRCVQKMTGVKCTMSWESIKIFYQNFKGGTYAHNIEKPVDKDLGKYVYNNIMHFLVLFWANYFDNLFLRRELTLFV